MERKFEKNLIENKGSDSEEDFNKANTILPREKQERLNYLRRLDWPNEEEKEECAFLQREEEKAKEGGVELSEEERPRYAELSRKSIWGQENMTEEERQEFLELQAKADQEKRRI